MPLISAWTRDEGARRTAALLDATFGVRPDGVWCAPGRVNLIGEHLDYNGGSVLPIALPHATYAALRRRTDRLVRLTSEGAEPAVWEGSLDAVRPAGQAPTWVKYAAGPAWAVEQAGARVGGFDAAITSCVPVGAGLSSSAALECSLALALNDAFGLGLDRRALADAGIRAENDVVGAPTGGMDQAAALITTAGHALLLHGDGSTEQVPFDLDAAGLALLVIDTRAHHALADGQYGHRRATCEAVAARCGVATLASLPDPQVTLAHLSDDVERRRTRHVVTEIERVGEVVALVRAGRVAEIGPLLAASHESLRDDYQVSCSELDAAVAAALDAGALGARMTGGGFGGSAIALVGASDVEAVSDAVARAFAARGFGAPQFLAATASAPGDRVR